MEVIRDQRPSGGCANCGAAVRSRKDAGWVCSDCQRREDSR